MAKVKRSGYYRAHKKFLAKLSGEHKIFADKVGLRPGTKATEKFKIAVQSGDARSYERFREWDDKSRGLVASYERKPGTLTGKMIERALSSIEKEIKRTGQKPRNLSEILFDAEKELRERGSRAANGKVMVDGMSLAERYNPRFILERDIQEINPFFEAGDRTASQLRQDYNKWSRFREQLDDMKEVDPEGWEKALREGYHGKTIRQLSDDAIAYGSDIIGRKPTSNPDTPNAQFLTESEIAGAKSILDDPSVPSVRSKIGAQRTASNSVFGQMRDRWNFLIDDYQKTGVAVGWIDPKKATKVTPKMLTAGPNRFVPKYDLIDGYLSEADLWAAKRHLQYGHLGAASNPSFFYAINDPSNAGPEFKYWNVMTSAGMTPTEYEIASRRLAVQDGFMWDADNLRRFDYYIEEIRALEGMADEFGGRLHSPANEEAYEFFKRLPANYIGSDPQRDIVLDGILSGENQDHHLLTNNRNRFVLDNAEDLREAIKRRVMFLKSLPQVDLNTALKVRNTPFGISQLSQRELLEFYDELKNTDPKVIQEFKDTALNVLREEPGLTVDQAFRKAQRLMRGRVPATLIGLASSVSMALADSPDDETKIDAIFRGLEEYDKAITQPGAEAIMGVADAAGVGDAMRTVDAVATDRMENAPAWTWGSLGPIKKAVTQLGYDALKYLPAEVVGLGIEGVTGKKVSAEADNPQVYPPLLNPDHDYSLDKIKRSLPDNVMELYQQPTPWKKYGGVVQSMTPTNLPDVGDGGGW